jgi:peptidoglycan hydrolase-like protein with peptidoglycan-binding domain
MRRTALIATLAAIVATPSAALAQQPAIAPPPAPVQSQMQVALDHVGGKLATVLVGTTVRVRGSVGTFVDGEQVTVRFYYSGTKWKVRQQAILPGPNGTGQFALSYRTQRSGRLVVRASHLATAALGTLAATAKSVDVIPRSVGPHSQSRAVRALQRRLSALGYVVGKRGSFDDRTARAVLAFRKVTGMARTSDASVDVMRRIARGGGAFKVRHPEHGRHVEADLTRQVMALISGGRALRVYPISSGKPSTPTILGSFRVYSKTPGINQKGMVDSAYFYGGYATHGYATVPIYPASHGCLRSPVPDARSIFDWIKIGTPVDVYYGPKP